MIHIAGLEVMIGRHVRQRCGWCGALLVDIDMSTVQAAVDHLRTPPDTPGYPTWPVGALVDTPGVGAGYSHVVEHLDGGPMPQDACSRLDPTVTR